MQSTDRVAASGMVVAERYRLIEPLGSGGMGAVWRAEHLNLRSPVAVKLLNPAIADDPEMLERFLREAQSAAALRGTYVVQVFDYGVHDGLPFIAMELLSGLSLGHRLTLAHTLSTTDLSWIFANVSRAVSKAHELGIVHRDLKPDNIFIVRDGDEEIAKVLDFGIAKVLPSSIPLEEDNSQTTRTGTVLGTPFYMSPEQARGNKAVDYRADLWAMGVIAFECLTGRLPFTSSALGDLVVKICTHPTPQPSSFAPVPEGFDEWFFRACEKAPEDRFQSIREQNDALQAILGNINPIQLHNRSTPRGRRVDADALLSEQLVRDIGDFQTLESIQPPRPGAVTPTTQVEDVAGSVIPNAAPALSTNSTPGGIVVTPRQRSSRWVPAVVLAVIIGGGLFALRRVNSKQAPHLEPQRVAVVQPEAEPPSSVIATTSALGPSPAEATTTQSPLVSPPVPETAAATPATSSTKSTKKATGPRLPPRNPTKLTSKLETTMQASTPASAAPVLEPVSPSPAPTEATQARGLFDDRE